MAHKNPSNWSPYTARKKPRHGTASGSKKIVEQRSTQESPTNPSSAQASSWRGRHRRPTIIYSQVEAEARIADVFLNHEFAHINRRQVSLLASFYRLLMENQQHSNFTRLVKLRDVAIKHFIDCLIIPQFTELKFPLMDLGSGPGFPGIPLKIIFPEKPIILAEGVKKRADFLHQVREKLNLANLEILSRNVNAKFNIPIAGVITRAVEDIGNTLANVSQSLEVGGKVYFMKGPNVDPEIPMAQRRWSGYYECVQDTAYCLAKTPHRRRLIVFQKISPIPHQVLRQTRSAP